MRNALENWLSRAFEFIHDLNHADGVECAVFLQVPAHAAALGGGHVGNVETQLPAGAGRTRMC